MRGEASGIVGLVLEYLHVGTWWPDLKAEGLEMRPYNRLGASDSIRKFLKGLRCGPFLFGWELLFFARFSFRIT